MQSWWNKRWVRIKKNDSRLRQTFARWAGTQCTNGPSVQIWSNTFHKGKKTLVTQSFSWQGEATRTAISVCMLLKAPDALSCMRVWHIAVAPDKNPQRHLLGRQHHTCELFAHCATCRSSSFSQYITDFAALVGNGSEKGIDPDF